MEEPVFSSSGVQLFAINVLRSLEFSITLVILFMASIDLHVGQERTCEDAKPSKDLKSLAAAAAVVDQVSWLAFI